MGLVSRPTSVKVMWIWYIVSDAKERIQDASILELRSG